MLRLLDKVISFLQVILLKVHMRVHTHTHTYLYIHTPKLNKCINNWCRCARSCCSGNPVKSQGNSGSTVSRPDWPIRFCRSSRPCHAVFIWHKDVLTAPYHPQPLPSACCVHRYTALYQAAQPSAATPLTFPSVDALGDQCIAGAAPGAAWSPAKSFCVLVWR